MDAIVAAAKDDEINAVVLRTGEICEALGTITAYMLASSETVSTPRGRREFADWCAAKIKRQITAFPTPPDEDGAGLGMSIRDWFAGQAIVGLLAADKTYDDQMVERAAKLARTESNGCAPVLHYPRNSKRP